MAFTFICASTTKCGDAKTLLKPRGPFDSIFYSFHLIRQFSSLSLTPGVIIFAPFNPRVFLDASSHLYKRVCPSVTI